MFGEAGTQSLFNKNSLEDKRQELVRGWRCKGLRGRGHWRTTFVQEVIAG
jgi:hypothetical protein